MCFFPMKPFGHIVSEISSRRITTDGDEDEDVVVGAVAPNNAESIGEYGGEAVDLHLAEQLDDELLSNCNSDSESEWLQRCEELFF